MQLFTKLFSAIDSSTKTNDKVEAMVLYFKIAPEKDITWAVALLCGRRPKRLIKTSTLKELAIQQAAIPQWLFDECYQTVGDLAETISLLIKAVPKSEMVSLTSLMDEYLALTSDNEKLKFTLFYWGHLIAEELFVFNKIITGGFRVGVSQALVIKALAKTFQFTENHIAHCLMGNWLPQSTNIIQVLKNETNADVSKPYPFYLAYSLDVDFETLGNINSWQIERKFDGIRGQLIIRNNEVFVWSRGEELVTDKFPEFKELPKFLPNGLVLDGEILPVLKNQLLPFALLQQRLGRKNVSKKMMAEIPLTLMCYDILEYNGEDIRQKPLIERRKLLEQIITQQSFLKLSDLVECNAWEKLDSLRNEAKQLGCEGLMLKKKESVYEVGRRRGNWWKWKVEPYTVDAILIYAQTGHGRRANLYTDYTFAIWDEGNLVPFTKAYSGLTDKEILEVDAWIKKNTREKFGPVRSVNAELVFEIAFEGIQLSPRHKSGIALRFPRISRWRKDKPKEEANTKQDLLNLLNSVSTSK